MKTAEVAVAVDQHHRTVGGAKWETGDSYGDGNVSFWIWSLSQIPGAIATAG